MNSPQESNVGIISPNFTQTDDSSFFSNKNAIIILLIILLVFSFLGINILNILGDLIQLFIQIFGPLVSQILSIFGYTTGTGIDIAEGSIQSVGNILRDASQTNVDSKSKQSLDSALNTKIFNVNEPRPDSTTNPIQNPITAGKQGWCLVGEYQGKRGCIEVGEHDRCLSGQVFPNQKMCLNPTLTQT